MTLLLKNSDEHQVTVSISTRELGLIANALNEVLNGLDIDEFDVRLGVGRAEAERLLHGVHQVLATAG